METVGELTIRPRMHSEPAESNLCPDAVSREDSDGQQLLVADVEQTSSEMGNSTSNAPTDSTAYVNCDEEKAELETVDRGETTITIKPAFGESSNAN